MIVDSFTAPSYRDRTLEDVQRCRNLYVERMESGYTLISMHGLSLKVTVPNNAACRGAIGFFYQGSTYIYSVHGNTVYRVYADASTPTSVGTLNTSSGRVRMAANATQVLTVDGTDGYITTIVSGTTAAIADANFPANPQVCVFLDGFFIVNDGGTGRFYLSAVDNGTNWTPVTRGNAESAQDHLVDIETDGSKLILLGANSSELWYNTNNASLPFERISGAIFGVGTPDFGCVAMLNGVCFFVGSAGGGRGAVYILEGGAPRKVSTPSIEENIRTWIYGNPFAFGYNWEGHQFFQVTNPTSGKTWVYDLTEDAWHERKSSGLSYNRTRLILSIHQAMGEGPFAFDTENGKVYEILKSVNTEDGTALTRDRDFGPIGDGVVRLFHGRIDILLEADHDSSASYTLSGTLSWSDNGGLTFSPGITLSKAITSGTTGQLIRLSATRLGSSRKRIYRLTMTGPAGQMVFKTCDLEIEAGRH